MREVSTPQSRCRVGIARTDITPPVGMYHRMWGAALRDCSTGIHRPLEASILWMEPLVPACGSPQALVSLDHCLLDCSDALLFRTAVATATGLAIEQVQLTVSHTHGAGRVTRTRSDFPGGHLIGPYLDDVAAKLGPLAIAARDAAQPATLLYGTGRCNLAGERDFVDPEHGHSVCGWNPDGIADDTLLVVKVVSDQRQTLAVIVNYACHPTTLAWQNTLISPDYVGALRETIEQVHGGICLFLQGASADLGPRDGFTGDTEVADRNGRQLAYAALATLETLPAPGMTKKYTGPVISGAVIGTWQYVASEPAVRQSQHRWDWRTTHIDLPYRYDLPDRVLTLAERDRWLREEELARQQGNEIRVRDCRAKVEQHNRQLVRLEELPEGRTFPLAIRLARLGDAIWLFLPGEIYQVLQLTLRQRFAQSPLVITTLSNDWAPGYIPPASKFGYGIYQEIIAATAPGALELLIEHLSRELGEWLKVEG